MTVIPLPDKKIEVIHLLLYSTSFPSAEQSKENGCCFACVILKIRNSNTFNCRLVWYVNSLRICLFALYGTCEFFCSTTGCLVRLLRLLHFSLYRISDLLCTIIYNCEAKGRTFIPSNSSVHSLYNRKQINILASLR